MSGSPLFAVRRFLLDLGTHLGSWRLSIALMVLAGLYHALLAIWSTSSPTEVVRNIATLLPFWLVYGLLLLNTGVCFWRRWPLLRKSLAPGPALEGATPDETVTDAAVSDAEGARRWLRLRGFRVSQLDDGRLFGLRRRHAALGSYLFHGAFFLLAAGFLLTLATREEARVWVAVGERFEGEPEQVLSRSAPRVLAPGLPEMVFDVADVRPEFWGDQLLFTSLAADLVLRDGERATTRINRPLWLGGATFLRLSGFGYAPRYALTTPDGLELDSAFVKMNVFPPGQRDHFRLDGFPHRFYVEVLPDHVIAEGQHLTRSSDLVNPAVVLRVFRGRLDLGGAVLAPAESWPFEGLRLGFPEIRTWGEFTVVSDPGFPVLLLSYIVGLAGLLLKLRGRREEAQWAPGDGDSPGTLRTWGGTPWREAPLTDDLH